MSKILIDTLLECRAKFEQYANEHKAKADKFKADAAGVSYYNHAEQRELMALSRAAKTKEGVNRLMVSAIDDAIKATQSQPAATVQEAIDFKYWLMDAARILRSNGTDTHASWVEKALAALSPSKAVEPAPEQGEELQAALKLDDNGFCDSECIAISLDRYARDAKRSGITAGMVVGQEANEQLRRIDAALSTLPHKEEATPATTTERERG